MKRSLRLISVKDLKPGDKFQFARDTNPFYCLANHDGLELRLAAGAETATVNPKEHEQVYLVQSEAGEK